jgi:hypothetical protein
MLISSVVAVFGWTAKTGGMTIKEKQMIKNDIRISINKLIRKLVKKDHYPLNYLTNKPVDYYPKCLVRIRVSCPLAAR